jgi:hypothetical protein
MQPPDHNHRGAEDGHLAARHPCAPHGITDTHKEQPGNDLLAFLNSTADVSELVGFSTRKDDA